MGIEVYDRIRMIPWMISQVYDLVNMMWNISYDSKPIWGNKKLWLCCSTTGFMGNVGI